MIKNLLTRRKENNNYLATVSRHHIRLYQIDKSALATHFWDKGHNIQTETKLLKHITNPKELTVWEKLFINSSVAR